MMSESSRHPADGLPFAEDFVGRASELETICSLLLGSTRLITLIGPGGIGKTRLALEAIRRYRKAKRGPSSTVYWVGLARLLADADTAAVEEEVARCVLDADFATGSTFDALAETLARSDAVGKPIGTVLVLDNCEHVLNPAGKLITELLAAVPGLTVLATSRQPIGWVDEYLLTVPPLTQQQALSLFRTRAQLVGFVLAGEDQVETARQICGHMDNHPLYIRLAAAQLRRRPLATILQQLGEDADDGRLAWPSMTQFGADSRHLRMHDAIAWSYDLCQPMERLLLDRMSVFAACGSPAITESAADVGVGADLDAIRAICADPDPFSGADSGAQLTEEEIGLLLDRLVDQSLVSQHVTDTAIRYSLLEGIRVFARKQLAARSVNGIDEQARLAACHMHYYRDRVAGMRADGFASAEPNQLSWARAEWDNILTAIETCITTPGQAATGLDICFGLIGLRFPFLGSSLREMSHWLERIVQANRALHSKPTELELRAMSIVAMLALLQGRSDDGERLLDVAASTALADRPLSSDWLQHPEIDIGLPGYVELTWSTDLSLIHHDPRAIMVSARAREKFQRAGDEVGVIKAELSETFAASLLGTPELAMDVAQRHLDRTIASDVEGATIWAEMAWSIAATRCGDVAKALDIQRHALTHQLAIGDQWGASSTIEFRIWSLARAITDSLDGTSPDHAAITTQAREIAMLSGGNRTLRTLFGVPVEGQGPVALENQAATAVARQVLGEEEYLKAEAEGHRLRPEHSEVQKLALGTLPTPRPPLPYPIPIGQATSWYQLSAAERLVAIQAAAGWTNAAIAARRGTSVKTVNAQVGSVLQKLSINSRADIIGAIPRKYSGQLAAEAAQLRLRNGPRSDVPNTTDGRAAERRSG